LRARAAEQGKRNDGSYACDDGCRRNGISKHKAPRYTAGLVLSSEEIHGARNRLERNFRCAAHFLRFDFKETGEFKAEEAGNDVIRKIFSRIVVSEDGIIERLPGKSHLVLSACELFLELHHILIRFEIRISFRQRKQPAESVTQCALGGAQFFHGLCVGWIGFGGIKV